MTADRGVFGFGCARALTEEIVPLLLSCQSVLDQLHELARPQILLSFGGKYAGSIHPNGTRAHGVVIGAVDEARNVGVQPVA
jgi:hypothetical protein